MAVKGRTRAKVTPHRRGEPRGLHLRGSGARALSIRDLARNPRVPATLPAVKCGGHFH